MSQGAEIIELPPAEEHPIIGRKIESGIDSLIEDVVGEILDQEVDVVLLRDESLAVTQVSRKELDNFFQINRQSEDNDHPIDLQNAIENSEFPRNEGASNLRLVNLTVSRVNKAKKYGVVNAVFAESELQPGELSILNAERFLLLKRLGLAQKHSNPHKPALKNIPVARVMSSDLNRIRYLNMSERDFNGCLMLGKLGLHARLE